MLTRYLISGNPKIIRDNLQYIGTITVGRQYTRDIEVIGDPTTEKVWTDEKGGILEDNEHIKIENGDYSSRITFSKGQRKHTQKYKFRIENCNGDDEEFFELVVLGPPSRPMGPLECTDVTSSTCKLHWLPPEDDGGLPVQEYEVEKLDPRTKRWVKIGKVSADKRPLTFDVSGLEEGQEYEFRVTAINAEGESDALTTDCAIKAKNPFGEFDESCMHATYTYCFIFRVLSS